LLAISTEIAEAPVPPPSATPTFFRRRRLKIVLVGFLAVVTGVAALWTLTVRDDAVVKRIQGAEGKKVALHYKEKRGVPSSCFGDAHYFINDVRSPGP